MPFGCTISLKSCAAIVVAMALLATACPAMAQFPDPLFDELLPPSSLPLTDEESVPPGANPGALDYEMQIDELQRALSEQQGLIEQLSSRLEEQAAAEPPDMAQFESRLSQLEGQVEAAGTSKFVDAISTVASRHVNGRIHIDEWAFPISSPGVNTIENGDPALDPENRLLYRRIRFGVTGDVPPGNMAYRVEIEFSGQDGSRFRDAWIGWNDLGIFNTLRVGNQKRPYGWDHRNSSNFMIFLERPFIVDALNEDSRRFGVASYGVSDDQAFNWQYGVFELTEVQDVGSVVEDRVQPELAGRLAHTLWYDTRTQGADYAHLGFAGTVAFPDGNSSNNQAQFRTRPEGRSSEFWLDTAQLPGTDTYEILGIESVYNAGPFQCAGEFMNLWVQGSTIGGDHMYLHGGYIYFSYFLTGEHIPWDRTQGVIGRVQPFHDFIDADNCRGRGSLGWGAWQTALRLSYADFNDDGLQGGIGQSLTLAVNWHWNANARMQFNYIFGRVDDRLADLGAGGTQVVSGPYEILGTRFIIDF